MSVPPGTREQAGAGSVPVSTGVPGPIGRSVRRVEDELLLRGEGRFVDDIPVDGVLHARFVRSPFAHARIERIDTAAAKAVPGVVAVFTGADLALGRITPPLTTPGVVELGRQILPTDATRYSGEPLAVVIALSAYEAEDAAELVDAVLEELPPVLDPETAADAEAPLIHDIGTNVVFDRSNESGDVDLAFKRAEVVVERTFRSGRCAALPMETRAILAYPEGEGLRVHASMQIPHRMRTVLCEILGMRPDKVAVVAADVGGSFGQKGHIYPEDVAVAWAARELRRPVKFVEDRLENLLASSHARDQRIRLRVAADRDGRIRAMDAEVLSDIGAYGVDAHGPTLEAGGTPSMIPGPYDVPAYRFRTRAVVTTKCPHGAYRGVGLPMAVLAHERTMDLVANELGLDRAEVRRRNLIRPEQLPYTTATGRTYDNGDYPRALETALRQADYEHFDGRRREAAERGRLAGLGIASFVEYTGMNRREYQQRGMLASEGVDSAEISVGKDGRATVWVTMPSVGQGILTTFTQIAAEGLGLPVDAVRVLPTDTSVSGLIGQGTGASRGMAVGGNAVYQAATDLHTQVRKDAADLLGLGPGEIDLRDGEFMIRGTEPADVCFADLVAHLAPDGYRTTATYESESVSYSYATHVCAVEVDPVTGSVEIPLYAVADDCGRVINPMIVHGQVRGGVVQGIGVALYEEHHYDANGQLQTASLMDYLIPLATDVPDIAIESFELPAPSSVLGAKGMGESGTLGPPAAIANAISDALDHEVNELPVTPAWIRSVLRGRTGPRDAA